MDDESKRILDHCVRFEVGGKEVGCFDFGANPLTFTGEVDESARLFVGAVLAEFERQQKVKERLQ